MNKTILFRRKRRRGKQEKNVLERMRKKRERKEKINERRIGKAE